MTNDSNTDLDPSSFPRWRERVAGYEDHPSLRSYPGYPTVPLPKPKKGLPHSLERILSQRQCHRSLSTELPNEAVVGRVLQHSHGIVRGQRRGPVPSAGDLQGLELYLAPLNRGWLEVGSYHYDRAAHALARIADGGGRDFWTELVPSLATVSGGALLWIVVGDSSLICQKYGGRGKRFLLLEAGHLMQNLSLMSTAMKLCTVPLGGFFEAAITRQMSLPNDDLVLYVGICGSPG